MQIEKQTQLALCSSGEAGRLSIEVVFAELLIIVNTYFNGLR